MFGPHRVVGLEVARHVGEVHGDVHQVFPTRAAGFQHGAHVGEHRARLRLDFVLAHAAVGEIVVARDRVGRRVARADAGEEQQVADAAGVRIHADGLRCRVTPGSTSLMRGPSTCGCARWRPRRRVAVRRTTHAQLQVVHAAVEQGVDTTVHRERLPARPGVLHDRWSGRRWTTCSITLSSHRRAWRSDSSSTSSSSAACLFAHVAHVPQPVVGQAHARAGHARVHAAAAVVAGDQDVLDLQQVHGERITERQLRSRAPPRSRCCGGRRPRPGPGA
jgi:hypothetical protein